MIGLLFSLVILLVLSYLGWNACMGVCDRRRNRRTAARLAATRAPAPLPASDPEAAWVAHHLRLAASDPAEWPFIIGAEHEWGGIYWLCPNPRCTASGPSHKRSGCNSNVRPVNPRAVYRRAST